MRSLFRSRIFSPVAPMLNRILFTLALGLALALVGLVVFAPGTAHGNFGAEPTWLALFARDATVRRASIACAIGLVVTATVFFRSGPSPVKSEERAKRPRSANTIGA